MAKKSRVGARPWAWKAPISVRAGSTGPATPYMTVRRTPMLLAMKFFASV
ncbi:hypothetical protein [Janthinobacterium agaricidamnosum]|nr:hypothetical protein [Janthinobacterium agaricidamnosum]